MKNSSITKSQNLTVLKNLTESARHFDSLTFGELTFVPRSSLVSLLTPFFASLVAVWTFMILALRYNLASRDSLAESLAAYSPDASGRATVSPSRDSRFSKILFRLSGIS